MPLVGISYAILWLLGFEFPPYHQKYRGPLLGKEWSE